MNGTSWRVRRRREGLEHLVFELKEGKNRAATTTTCTSSRSRSGRAIRALLVRHTLSLITHRPVVLPYEYPSFLSSSPMIRRRERKQQ